MNGKVLCIHHGHCDDGIAAAWCVAQAFGYDAVDFHPASYGSDPPDVTAYERVVIVDFSYPRDVTVRLRDEARRLLILDHHETARDALEDLDCAVFDMRRSGAGLAWDTFIGGNRPWFIDHIEDRDLWRFQIETTKQFTAWSRAQCDGGELSFALLDALRRGDFNRGEVERAGAGILAHIERQVERIARGAHEDEVEQTRCVVANSPVYQSELGNLLAVRSKAIALIWWKRDDGKIQVSVRADGMAEHAGRFAQRFGGGGHPGAGGFVLDAPKPWLFGPELERAA